MNIRYTVTRTSMTQGLRLLSGFWRIALAAGLGYSGAMLLIQFAEHLPTTRSVLVQLVLLALTGLAFGVFMSAFLMFVLIPFRVWQMHRQSPVIFGETVLSTDEEGIEIRGPRATSSWNWSDLRGFKEDRKVIVLRINSALGITVPKNDLPPELIDEFRAELIVKLKRLRY